MHDQSPPKEDVHWMLSEFDRPGLRWLFRALKTTWMLPLAAFVWAFATLVVGHAVGANYMALELTAKLNGALLSGHLQSVSSTQVFGYLAQANCGVYYLLCGPVMIFISLRFVHTAQNAVHKLTFERTLTPTAGDVVQQPACYLGLRNKSLCRWLLYSPLIVLGCWANQFLSLDHVSKGYPTSKGFKEVGHVQAPYHQKWCEAFEGLPSEVSRFETLESCGFDHALSQMLFERLKDSGSLENPKVLSWLRLQKQGQPRSPSNQPIGVDLAVAVESGDISLSAVTRGGPDSSHSASLGYMGFIAMREFMVGMYFAFTAFCLVKALFWLWHLYRFLPSVRHSSPFEFKPLASDSAHRYGLSDLFAPYNLLVFLLAVGALFVALQFRGQTGMDTYLSNIGSATALTRFINIVVICAVVLGIVVGPMIVFASRMKDWAKLRQQNYSIQKRAMDSDDERDKIDQKARLLAEQATWPAKDPKFLGALLAVFAFLFIPIWSVSGLMPTSIAKYIDIAHQIKNWAWTMSVQIYDNNAPNPTL